MALTTTTLTHLLAALNNASQELFWILNNRVVQGDWDWQSLCSAGLVRTLAGKSLNVSEYLAAITVSKTPYSNSSKVPPSPQRRYCQIHASNGRMVAIGGVLSPFDLSAICPRHKRTDDAKRAPEQNADFTAVARKSHERRRIF